MAKTQTIIFKKAGSDWADAAEAMTELLGDVSATTPDTDSTVATIQAFNTELDLDIDTQSFSEVRTFLNDAEYDTHKSNMTSIETTVNDELTALGWEITDTVE